MNKRNICQKFIFLLLAVSSLQSYSQCTTSVSGYSYFKKITIDETKVSGTSTHTNIPILISHTDPDLRTTANGGDVQNTNGWDIIFTDENGTQIDYQRQKYAATTGEIIAWVEIPSLSATINTSIYIYFGNASVGSDPSTTATWNANYKGVWHLEEDPSGTAPQMIDGTANINNLTTYGTMLSAQEVSAKIENGSDMDGTDDYISKTYDPDFDFGYGSFSAATWFKTAGSAGVPPQTFSTRISTGNDDIEEATTGVMDINSTDLEMVDDGTTTDQKIGMRFTGITIPQGATINSATIDFYADLNESNPTNLTFWGEDIDNAPVFTTAAFNLSGRTFTSASVAWSAIPAWTDNITYTTPDLKTIVQAIVNRVGWVSGNAVVFKVEGSGLVNETRRAESYEGAPLVAAFLQINYTPPPIQTIISRYDNDQGFKLWLNPSGNLIFAIDNDETWGPDYSVTSAGTYNNNLWHYAVAVKNDTNSIQLFVDGASVGSTPVIGTVKADVNVSAGSDDAEENNATGAVSVSSTDLEIITDGTIDQTIGIRFNGLNIPNGATIDNAVIEFTVNATTNIGSPTFTITCENVDNASTFTTAAFNITARPKTTASASWTPPNWTVVGAKERTSDITAPIQEVVNRAGWTSGNSLVFIITGPTNTKRAANAWNFGSEVPRLLINYKYSLTSNSAPATIGSDEPTNGYYFDGVVDEVRLSNTNPSSDRITTEYNSQNSPATFYSIGLKKTIYYWTGTTNTDWNTPSNWTPAGGPPGSDNTAIIQNVANDPVLNVNAAIGLLYIQPLGVFNGSSNTLIVNSGLVNDGTFNPQSGTIDFAATSNQKICHNIYNNLTVSGSGTKELTTSTSVIGNLSITGTAALDVTTGNYPINISGNYSNSGTSNFIARAGTVTFNGTSADQSLASGGDVFYNLTINNTALPGSDDISLSDALDVNNNLTITDGDLNSNGNNISVGGNWNNTGGSFTHGSSNSVTFDGTSADQTIRSGSSNFFNLIINNTATSGNDDILPLDNLVINNDITITDGDLNANGFNFSIYGNWSRTGGSFTPGANSVSFLGTGAQAISATGGETFYTWIINNTSAASTITLNSIVNITNNLTLTDGHIITTAINILKMGVNATITLNGTPQENSFVKGPMIHTVGSSAPATVDVYVNASSDDAEEDNATGAMSLSSTDLEIIRDGTIDQTCGIRFNGISIPNSSTIDSAFIEFTVNATTNIGSPTFTIKCENADNASTFTTAAFNITSRTTTAASSWSPPNWTVVGAKERTSDITAPIQQVVNRSGWASGNSLVVIITGPTNTKRAADSWNGSAANAPRLLVYYRADPVTLTKVYPVGAGTRYRRADLNIDQNGAVATEYTGEQLNSSATALGYTLPPTLNRVSGISYWTITKGAGASVNSASVKLWYESGDQVTIAADLRVAKDDGAGNWVDLGGVGTGAPSGTITSTNNFTTFSKFSLANVFGGPGNPLPIELLDFSGTCNNQTIILRWSTAAETNNDYFTIERSADGISYMPIGTVKGVGNSSTSYRSYKFIDSTIIEGGDWGEVVVYYRLKQTDFDGKYTYSELIAVENCKNNLPGFIIFPNPNSGKFILEFPAPDSSFSASIIIDNSIGQTIYKSARCLIKNSQSEIDLSQNQSGIYFLQGQTAQGTTRQKIIINK